jgi:hypothetical protein
MRTRRKQRRDLHNALKADGNCFEVAALIITDYSLRLNLRLVHAEVSGRGPLEGKTFVHAWVEDPDSGLAIDQSNGLDVAIPIEFYRAGARIRGDIVSYTFKEAARLMLEHGHYGPWDARLVSLPGARDADA